MLFRSVFMLFILMSVLWFLILLQNNATAVHLDMFQAKVTIDMRWSVDQVNDVDTSGWC